MIRTPLIFILILTLIASCQKGFDGHYEKENWYRIKLPSRPEIANEEHVSVFGQHDLEVALCEPQSIEGAVFKMYSGPFESLESAIDKNVDFGVRSFEDMIFKKNPQANGMINDVLSSISIIRDLLDEFELLDLKLVQLRGYPGMVYHFANGKTKETCKIETYWVGDRIYLLYAKGKFDEKSKQKYTDFFDYLQIIGRGDYDGPPWEGIGQDNNDYPNINYYSYASHPYKPVYKKEVVKTAYGSMREITKMYMPRGKHDVNTLYFHSMAEFDSTLNITDTTELDQFYQEEIRRLVQDRESDLISYEWFYQSGYLSVKFEEKSREKEEYCTTVMTLVGQYLFKFQVVTPAKRTINDSKRRFFTSARIRKKI